MQARQLRGNQNTPTRTVVKQTDCHCPQQMSSLTSVVVVASLLMMGAQAAFVPVWGQLSQNASHTGLAKNPGAESNHVAWKVTIGAATVGEQDSAPVVTADGTVFVGGNDSYALYSISPTGVVNWKYSTGGCVPLWAHL